MAILNNLELYKYIIIADFVPIIGMWFLLGLLFLSFLRLQVSVIALKLLQFVYSSNFGQPGKNEEEKKVTFELKEKWISLKVQGNVIHFPQVLNGLVALLLYSVCATSFAVFWDSTIVRSKMDNCIFGDGFDCFLRNSRLTAKPLNCSNFTDTDNIGVVCHKLQWDYGQGISDAGGMFSAATFTLFLVVFGILKIKKVLILIAIYCCYKCCSCKCCCSCCYRMKHHRKLEKTVTAFMFVVQLVALAAMSFVFILFLTHAPLWDYFRYNAARMMKTLCLLFTLFMLACIPWYFCYIEYDVEETKNKND